MSKEKKEKISNISFWLFIVIIAILIFFEKWLFIFICMAVEAAILLYVNKDNNGKEGIEDLVEEMQDELYSHEELKKEEHEDGLIHSSFFSDKNK